jgi:hypothetical protein
MKDVLITFETAKLAKEKGFSVGTYGCLVHYKTSQTHPEDGNSGPFGWEKGEITSDSSFIINGREDLGDYSNESYDCYELPTQSLLQKWLREVHNLHLYIDTTPSFEQMESHKSKYKVSIKVPFNPFKWTTGHYYLGDTYEEVLEIGLQEALKLI